jgi:ssDNA-binding Zn-finger/Zn-ribbon topoisomerase 1
MKKAYEKLCLGDLEITNQEHIENVRERQKNIKRGICPRCSGVLVLRKGKYGDFWGCSNYPKCKFIKKD